MNLGTSDYLKTINNGADIGIYGRYRDIENLGGDIEFDNTIRYKPSFRSKTSEVPDEIEDSM
jgi:hypothetical protein